jgi:hypothetical protein
MNFIRVKQQSLWIFRIAGLLALAGAATSLWLALTQPWYVMLVTIWSSFLLGTAALICFSALPYRAYDVPEFEYMLWKQENEPLVMMRLEDLPASEVDKFLENKNDSQIRHALTYLLERVQWWEMFVAAEGYVVTRGMKSHYVDQHTDRR